ncbi:MAG: hypothetical protein AB4426_34280 [Xenococcaceae cyanobacterium]
MLKKQWLSIWVVLIFFANELDINYVLAPGVVHPVKQSRQSNAQLSQKTDFDHESTDLIANVLYRRPASLYYAMAPSGANGVNACWERNQTGEWYIEAQRAGEVAVIGGLIKNDLAAIEAGFKMFDWGFARQAVDGSFQRTGDRFHSTSLFVQAVAHTLLVIQQSPQAKEYADKVAHYTPLVHRAARWMIQPEVWRRGIKHNQPFTHRRYLVAAALGLTGKLAGDRELIDYARQSIEEGLSLQRPDGVNPERGGHDSSYQMAGVIYAARWVTYLPDDPLTPRVIEMIEGALAWEESRILPSGEISSQGNTRTGGQESVRIGQVKKINQREVLRGFAYWASVTGNPRWIVIANKIVQFYYTK